MKTIKNLQDILIGKYNGKGLFGSASTKLGTFTDKIINENNIKTIFNLNELLTTKTYKDFAKDFLKQKKNNVYAEHCTGTLDELLDGIGARIEYLMLRKLYVARGGDRNKFSFSEYEMNFGNQYTLTYELSKEFEIGFNRGKITKKEREVLEVSKTIELVNEFIKPDTNTAIKSLSKEDLFIEVLENIENLKNFSPIIYNFITSSDKILLLTLATGLGKSTSFRRFIGNQYAYRRIVNKIIYLIDVKANIESEFEDLQKELKDFDIKALIIYSNIDCILKNKDAFLKLPAIFSNTSEYKNLKTLITNEKFDIRDLDDKERLGIKENDFRLKCREIISSIEGYKELKSVKDKFNFIKGHKELCEIINVYTNIKMYETNEWFININKFKVDIDTLIETISLPKHKEFLQNSLIFFDESDQLKERIMDIICEDSITAFDLYGYTDTILHNLENSDWFKKDENLKKFFDEILEDSKKIKLPYFDIKFDKDLDYKNWLFNFFNPAFLLSNEEKFYLIPSDSKDKMILISEEKLTVETKDDAFEYSKFVDDLNDVYIKMLRLLARLVYKIQKDEELTQDEALSNVLDKYLNVHKNTPDARKFKEDLLNTSAKYSVSEIDDPYLSPISTINTNNRGNILCAKIINYLLTSTPEKELYDLCQFEGTKIILSSATAAHKSVISNYNLEWDKIKPYIHVPSEKEKELILNYISEHDKYADDVKINISYANKSSEDNKKILLDNNLINEKILDEFEITIKEYDKRPRFKIKETYALLVDVYNKVMAGSHANLALLYYLVEMDDPKYKKLFDNFKENFETLYEINLKFIDIRSGNYIEKRKEIETSLYDQVSKDRKFVFIIGPYASAGKAINLQTLVKIKKDEIVKLNDFEKDKLDTEDEVVELKLDLSGIYLGNIYHVLPNINFDGTYNEKVQSILKILMTLKSLKAAEQVSDKDYEKIMHNLGKENHFLYKGTELKTSLAKAAKIIKILKQALGRLLRTNFKYKEIFITLDEDLREPLRGFSIDDFYDDYEYEQEAFLIKEVFENLLEEEREDYLLDLSVEKLNEAKSSHKELKTKINESTGKDLEENVRIYNSWHSSVTGYTITTEEYNKKDEEARKLYFKLPLQYRGIGKYSYEAHSEDREKIIDKAGDVRKYRSKINGEYGQNDYMLNLLSGKISFNNSNEYIITPKGEELLKGNIGETLGDIFLKELFGNVNNLPVELNEVTDRLCILDETQKIFVDIKYYTEQDEEFDSVEKNEPYFLNKLDTCAKYCDEKITILELNMRPCNEELEIEVRNFKNGQIVTVPNVYKNGEFDKNKQYEILEKLRG